MTKEAEYPIAKPVDAQGAAKLADNLSQARAGVPGMVSSSPNAKTYFVAFDGTGNNKNDPDRPPTNVAALFDSADKALSASGNGLAKYYQGAGTQGNPLTEKLDGLLGTSVYTTASQAYSDFMTWAQREYAANPSVEITLAGTSFSRGGASHTAFLNEVWNKGVPDPAHPGQYLIAPGTADLGVHVFYDRVLAGVRQDSTELMPDAPASKFRALEIVAIDEHRKEFVGDPINSATLSDPRILTLFSPGDHSDVGGGHWATGIGNYTLASGFAFFMASGLALEPVDAGRLPGALSLQVHDSFAGFWGRPGGDYLASWVEDRLDRLYYKEHPAPSIDTGIDAYTALPTQLSDSSWRFAADGMSVLSVSQQAQNLARLIVAPRGFLTAPSSAIASALDVMGPDTTAYVDSKGRLNLVNGQGGVAVIDQTGSGDLMQGGVSQTYRNGSLAEVATFKGIFNGTSITEVVTSDAKSRVYTVDVNAVLTETLYDDLERSVLTGRRITDAMGQCVATDYASNDAGEQSITQTTYEAGFGSKVLGQTVNTVKDTNGDGNYDRSEYAQYDGNGRAVGHVLEAATASPTSAGPLDAQVDQLHQAMAREDNYVLEVASLRRLVGAQGLNEAWAGTSLLRASDAPEQYVRGFETLDSILFDQADSLWLEGLKPTEWTGLRSNSMTVSEAAGTPSAAPGTGWTPAPTGGPGADWTGSTADWFGNARDRTQAERLGALYEAMGDVFGFDYSASSFTSTFGSGIYSSQHGGFGDDWSWGSHYTSSSYMPYYNDWSPSFDFPDPGYIDFGFDYSYYAPVALDLDGDGIELLSQAQSNVHFDVKGDGFASHVGWVGGDDAFLAIDVDGNGRIEGAKELSFALWTAAPDDSDLDGLRAVFDTNQDGRISTADAQFSQLRVWQDKNGDGLTDAGELRTLAQAGITSLSLAVAGSDWASGGNRVRGFTTYTRTDGSQGMAADVELGYTGPGWKSSVAGNLVKLTQTGGLAFGMAAGSAALNLDATTQGLGGVVGGGGADTLKATGAAAVVLQGGAGNDTLQGGAGDDWLSGGEGVDVLRGGAGDDVLLIDAKDLASGIDGGVGFDIAVVTGSSGVTLDLGPANLEAAIGSDGNDSFSNSGYGRVILAGGAGNDTLTGGRGDDVLEGGQGDDRLRDTSTSNDTYLYSRGDGRDIVEDWGSSGTGDRLLLADITALETTVTRSGADLVLDFGQGDRVTVAGYYQMSGVRRIEQIQFADGTAWGRWDLGMAVRGGVGADTLGSAVFLEDNVYVGGRGNDTFTDTGGGNDSYVFERGDGQDVITDGGVSENNDRLLLKGIRPDEVSLSRNGVDLVLDMGSGDRITVKRHFDLVGFNTIERVEFDGGAAWTTKELALAPVCGGTGADSLVDPGTFDEENTYIGGTGNDTITDAKGGSDTYVFSRGDGQDVVTDTGVSGGLDRIQLTDITARETHLVRSGEDLFVMLGGGDQITVRKHFSSLGWNKIEQIDFSDGTSWTSSHIDAAPVLFQGSVAADLYKVGKGAGSLAIVENSSGAGQKDVLQYSSASSSQLWFAREVDDLRVRIIGTNDTVLLQDWYLGSQYQVEQFTSSDGRQLTSTDVNLLVQAMAQFSPPAAGQTTLPAALQAALAPQLAVVWR